MTTDQLLPGRTPSRLIRVFVSSTFRDMQAERDELVKYIFPQLRKLCETREVTWGEVDLRWGITDEQKSEGKVLPICLEEIRRCRPYFIGMLGERYGWIPDEIPKDLVEKEPWLVGHQHQSVTELEILHGVLNNPEMAEHPFFYFRDPTFIRSLPRDMQSLYLENVTPEEVRLYGSIVAQQRADQRKQKLADLKQRIRSGGFPIHENYQDIKEFGQLVLNDITAIINKLYPEASQPDPLSREARDHAAYAHSRERVYIVRQGNFNRLDAYAAGSGDQPLVVLGESGSGKSALLANWAEHYRQVHPDDLVLEHYIGATPASADWVAMLRRIMGEFKRQLGIVQEIPEDPNALRSAFSNWLHMAASKGRVILILDALNQLENREGAQDLQWLPPVLPRNVRLVVSTLAGPPLEVINKRSWPTFEIKPLEVMERQELIRQYLAQYTKVLGPKQVAWIAAADQTAVPLYLRALLDELRQFGIHEKLDDQIAHYLAAPTVTDLYDLILARYEKDYESDRLGLVRDAMTFLWASRRGLSEAELLDLLGTSDQPLPRATWSPLYLAAESALVNRAGLLGFVHDYLRDAVYCRYLANGEQQRTTHLRLARYFENRPLGQRMAEELPYHFQHAEEWGSLANLLWNLDFLAYVWTNGLDRDVVGYWSSLRGRFEPVSGYKAAINRLEQEGGTPQQIVSHSHRIGWLLDRMAFFADSRKFYENAAQSNESLAGAESSETANDWKWIGLSYYAEGNFKEALSFLKRALQTQEHIHGPETTIVADLLSDIGLVYWEHGYYDEAKAYAERSLGLREKLLGQDHRDVALSLNNLAAIYHVQNLYTEALPLYQRALAIREKTLSPEDTDVAQIQNNLGALYFYLGRYQESMDHCLKALHIYEQAHGPFHPYVSTSCNNIANSYRDMGNLQEAEKWMKRAIEIDEVTARLDHPEAPIKLLNLGNIYGSMHRFQDALIYKKHALEIAEKVYGAHHFQASFIAKELAATNIEIGDLKSAEDLLRRASVDLEAAFGKSHPALANTFYWLGILVEKKKDLVSAQDYYQQAIAMSEKLLGPEHPDTKSYRHQLEEFRKLNSL